MHTIQKIFICLCLATLTACNWSKQNDKTSHDTEQIKPDHALSIDYAQHFTLSSEQHHMRLLTIHKSGHGISPTYRYALLYPQAEEDSVPQGYEPLRLPIKRIICMTSLQLAAFIALDATSYVTGITSTRHLFNEKMQEQLRNGQTSQIGIEGNFDQETIIAIAPELILISPSKRGGYDVLSESGLPLMPHLGYQEETPLGQAEWIKLIGVLTGKETDAIAYFDSVASRYLDIAQQVKALPETESRPTIMSGDMKGGHWYATGGHSYLAQIFHDAGARYFMEDNEDSGGVNLDFETVYAQGADADYWRVSNSFQGTFTYEDLAAEDSRFRDFRAYREHNVIYCNMAQTPFYESFPVRPDMLLSDFVAIFHPSLLPHHQSVYYKLLTP